MTTPTYAELIATQEFAFLASTDVNRQALITEFLSNAAAQVNQSWAGSRHGRMVALLAVHRLVLRDRQALEAQSSGVANSADMFLSPPMGSINSVSGSHGSSSVSLAPIKAGKEGRADYYAQTPFGLEYYELLGRKPIGFVSRTMRCGC